MKFVWRVCCICFFAWAFQAKSFESWQNLDFWFYKPIDFLYANGQINVVSESASSIFYRSLSEKESQANHLSWSWQVRQSSLPPTRLDSESGGDRLLGLYIFFNRYPVSKMTIEVLEKGNYIGYIWGATHAIGEVVSTSDQMGRLLMVRSHDSQHGIWYKENRDFMRDFQEFFGYPGYPVFVGITADTDGMQAKTLASVKDIRFLDP